MIEIVFIREDTNRLPSRFDLGDAVSVGGRNGTVVGVHFDLMTIAGMEMGKITYMVKVDGKVMPFYSEDVSRPVIERPRLHLVR